MAKNTKILQVCRAVGDFNCQGTGGDFVLSEQKGQYVVLFFYPRENTPGCTLEAHEFTKLAPAFKKLNAQVFGVSRDTLKSHVGFKEKQNYKLELLADPDEALCEQFQVIKEKNMYGKKVMGIERSTFLISPKGDLLHEWRKVKPEGHAQQVLETLKQITKN